MPLGYGQANKGTSHATSSSDSADISSELSIFSSSVTTKNRYAFDIRLKTLASAAAEYTVRYTNGGTEIARSTTFKASGLTALYLQSPAYKLGSSAGETIAVLVTGQSGDTAINYDVELFTA